ncbi:TetR/AcrR family transcriptional regulator [bacterium]|nr:TetR/AcrR family transcriptional regulator [bacterium]MCI0604844.1 TetR/AcrR family transcriptional regulator [bacterium]
MKDKLLDAAEAVVVRDGIGNLTLDSVSVEAGLSKGGLLHHFPTKEKLVEAMVKRVADSWRQGVLEVYAVTPEGPGRMVRATLNHCLANAQRRTDQVRRSSSAVFAALAETQGCPGCPETSPIEPMRAVYRDLFKRVAEDGLPPGVGEAAIAAIDGLWLYWVLGLVPINDELVNRVRGAIEEMITNALSAQVGATLVVARTGRDKPSLRAGAGTSPTPTRSRRKRK